MVHLGFNDRPDGEIRSESIELIFTQVAQGLGDLRRPWKEQRNARLADGAGEFFQAGRSLPQKQRATVSRVRRFRLCGTINFTDINIFVADVICTPSKA